MDSVTEFKLVIKIRQIRYVVQNVDNTEKG
jgi:hypothetical protein